MEQQPFVHDSPAGDLRPPPIREPGGPEATARPATTRRDNTARVLARHDGLFVREQKTSGESLDGWETNNRYAVSTRGGELLFQAGELAESKAAVFFLKNQRPFTIELRDPTGALFMTVTRPWRWFRPRAEVYGASGRLLGAIQRRWSWFRRNYSLEDAEGRPVAVVRASYFRRWRFRLLVGGQEQGVIAKQWSSSVREFFSATDNFSVTFDSQLSADLRPICLGATFLFEFVHFENSKRT